MLAHMCPWLRLHGVAADGESVVFVRRSGEMPTLFELSDGERDAVLWCASSERVGLDHSVVLIDRPEAYAHPDDVARWLSTLERNGNQRIVATTSEALLRAVPAAQHIRLGL
jgi:predicted ATPase